MDEGLTTAERIARIARWAASFDIVAADLVFLGVPPAHVDAVATAIAGLTAALGVRLPAPTPEAPAVLSA